MALDLSQLEGTEALEDLQLVTSEKGVAAALRCLAFLPAFIQATTDAQRAAAMRAAGEKLPLPPKQVIQVFRILYFLAEKVIEKSVDARQIEGNRQELIAFFGDEERWRRLVEIVKHLENNRAELAKAFFNGRRLSGVTPLFSGCQGTVDARVNWNDDRTEISDLVPIASVAIELDSGSPSSFSFQADLAGVEQMLALLNQLKDGMEKTRDYFLSKK